MKQRKSISIGLTAIFGGLSFAIRQFQIFVIPTPLPPLVWDLRGIPAIIGSCLVPVPFALIIGWFASGLDMLLGFGTDVVAFVILCGCVSFFYNRKQFSNPYLHAVISIGISQIIAVVLYFPVFAYFYAWSLSSFPFYIFMMEFRTIPTLIISSIIITLVKDRLKGQF